MIEQNLNLTVEQAYENLTTLLQKNCVLIIEEPSKRILVKQGSLWGLSPRTAKKMIDYRFSSTSSGTQIVVSSSLTPGWKNLTIIGSILSIMVAAFFWWISVDLEDFVMTHEPSFWSWLATSGSLTYTNLALSFINLTRWLAIFLVVAVFIEVIIYVYAQQGIDAIARETLKALV